MVFARVVIETQTVFLHVQREAAGHASRGEQDALLLSAVSLDFGADLPVADMQDR